MRWEKGINDWKETEGREREREEGGVLEGDG